MYANTVGEAFIYYGIRLVVFTAVAALGIWAGMQTSPEQGQKTS